MGVLMFGFGFALVPIYDVICEVAGINGKTSSQAYEGDAVVDESRKFEIFMSVNGGNAMAFPPRKPPNGGQSWAGLRDRLFSRELNRPRFSGTGSSQRQPSTLPVT